MKASPNATVSFFHRSPSLWPGLDPVKHGRQQRLKSSGLAPAGFSAVPNAATAITVLVAPIAVLWEARRSHQGTTEEPIKGHELNASLIRTVNHLPTTQPRGSKVFSQTHEVRVKVVQEARG